MKSRASCTPFTRRSARNVTTRFQSLDKPGSRSTKPLLLGRAERSPVLVKSRKPLIGRHLTERAKEGIAVLEHGSLASGDLVASLAPRVPSLVFTLNR